MAASSKRGSTDPENEQGSVEPHDLPSEEHVLGACLISPSALDRVAKRLKPEHFYRLSHGVIYATMLELRAGGAEADVVTVAAELEARGDLERAGGRSKLVELAAIVPSTQNVEHYARVVLDRAKNRTVYRALQELATVAANGGIAHAPELVQAVRQALDQPVDGDSKALVPLDLGLLLASDPPVTPWLWKGWIAHGDLVLLAGDPGVGKSMIALAFTIAARDGGTFLGDELEAVRTGYLDLEMARSEVHSRLYGFGLRWDVDGIDYFHAPDIDASLPGWVEKLEATIVERKLELLVIDSFRRLAPGVDENDSGAVSAILSPLRNLSSRLGVTIILVHHAKKRGGDTPNEAQMLVRGSGDFNASPDQLLFLRKKAGEPDAFTIEHGKSRRGAPHPSILVRIVEEELEDGSKAIRLESEGEVATTTDKTSELLFRICQVLREEGGPLERKVLSVRLGVDGRDSTYQRALSLGYQREQLVRSTEGRGKPTFYAYAFLEHDPHPKTTPDPQLELEEGSR